MVNRMKNSLLVRIFRFYVEGFREMTVGKTLWLIICLKLFVMFFILKFFFFPNFLGKHDTIEDKQEYVSGELINRAQP